MIEVIQGFIPLWVLNLSLYILGFIILVLSVKRWIMNR